MDTVSLSTSLSGDGFRSALTPIVQRELDARLPIAVDTALPRHVEARIVSAVEAQARTLRGSVDELSDSLSDLRRDIQKEEDELRSRVSMTRKEIDSQLEALEEKVKKKANSVLIPAATLVLVLGFLAIWAAMGSYVIKARAEAQAAVLELEALRSEVKIKQAELVGLGQEIEKNKSELATLGTQITAIRGNTALADLTQQIRVLTAKIDALESKKQQPKAAPAKSSPPKKP